MICNNQLIYTKLIKMLLTKIIASVLIGVLLATLTGYLYGLYCRWKYVRRPRYVLKTEVGSIKDIDYNDDMLNYKWFTGGDHRMYKINFDTLNHNECIHIKYSGDGHEYIGLGAAVKRVGGESQLAPVCDNISFTNTFEDQDIIITKNYMVGRLTQSKLMSDGEIKRIIIPASENDNDNKYLFYFDAIGGTIKDVKVEKYIYEGVVGLSTISNVLPYKGRKLESEGINIEKETIKNTISRFLAQELKCIDNKYKALPISHTEMIEWCKGNRAEMFYPTQDNSGELKDGIHRDVTRFITPEIKEDDITVFFINHNSTGKSLYSRLSLVDETGEELFHVIPSKDNMIGNDLHQVNISIPINKRCQLLESIYVEDVEYPSPSHNTVYPMMSFVCVDMIKQKSSPLMV